MGGAQPSSSQLSPAEASETSNTYTIAHMIYRRIVFNCDNLNNRECEYLLNLTKIRNANTFIRDYVLYCSAQ